MALDGIAVHALVGEFTDLVTDARIDKIYQPEKDEITLLLRTKTQNLKLLLSANSANPRAHFQTLSKKNPINAPQFCMLLRKHLSSGRLVSITQSGLDRVIDFGIESYTELGDLTVKHLIIEIMGRHSNIILTDENMRVLDSIKRIDFTVSSVRQIFPGITYELPPSQNKINPLDVTLETIIDKLNNADSESKADKFILSTFEGISPIISREVCYSAFQETDIVTAQLSGEQKGILAMEIWKLFSKIKQSEYFPCLLINKAEKKPMDFCVFDIKQYESAVKTEQKASISEAIEGFFAERDAIERKKQKMAELLKVINNNIDRCAKKVVLFHQTLSDAKNKEKYKLYGDLITSNLYRIKPGDEFAVVQNFYSPDCEDIKIKLDNSLTPQKNAQKFYKKYNKLKTAEQQAANQLTLAENELEYLKSILAACEMASSLHDISEIKDELASAGYIMRQKSAKKKDAQKPSAPLHFVSSDGFDIYCGKNNVQNDYLTLKMANNSDLWFHTKGFAGSHTIIKLGINKDVPESTIMEAASLAAYHSSAKNSGQVPVDYTLIKNVKKPSGAKPGMVIYEHYNTIYTTPDEELASRLKKEN